MTLLPACRLKVVIPRGLPVGPYTTWSFAGIPIDGKTVFTSDHALKLDWIPNWIAIIGSGYIGLEFSDVYTALGSDVTFIEVGTSVQVPLVVSISRVAGVWGAVVVAWLLPTCSTTCKSKGAAGMLYTVAAKHLLWSLLLLCCCTHIADFRLVS